MYIIFDLYPYLYLYTYMGGVHKWCMPKMDGLSRKIPLKWTKMDDLEVPPFQEHSIYSDGIRPKGSTRLSSPILNHHRFAGAGGCLQTFAGPGACCCQ